MFYQTLLSQAYLPERRSERKRCIGQRQKTQFYSPGMQSMGPGGLKSPQQLPIELQCNAVHGGIIIWTQCLSALHSRILNIRSLREPIKLIPTCQRRNCCLAVRPKLYIMRLTSCRRNVFSNPMKNSRRKFLLVSSL